MKVRITVTVDIDPEAWTTDYGVTDQTAIRDDVREWATNLVTEQLQSQMMLIES
jgi:hypothetical protein